jgi:hypothetical protein
MHLEDGYVVFRYSQAPRIKELAAASQGTLRVVDANSAYLPLGKDVAEPQRVLLRIKSLLQPGT